MPKSSVEPVASNVMLSPRWATVGEARATAPGGASAATSGASMGTVGGPVAASQPSDAWNEYHQSVPAGSVVLNA